MKWKGQQERNLVLIFDISLNNVSFPVIEQVLEAFFCTPSTPLSTALLLKDTRRKSSKATTSLMVSESRAATFQDP